MKKLLIVTASVISLAIAASQALASEPLEFQGTMKKLGTQMQTITSAIARENWELVDETAHKIAEHAQPPAEEKQRIVAFMGSNMAKFKAFDGQTHEAAHEVAEAAQVKNGQSVIAAFQKLQTSCLACHQAFRPAFTEHFYGKSK
ncbi:MAG: cytochrome c [Gallionella sp.]|jgi:cytochrome c556|nr:cytochrome c [Gallionella sp.]